MTEAEWLACEDASQLIIAMPEHGRVTTRTHALFVVVACRRLQGYYFKKETDFALRTLELYADGTASEEAMEQVFAHVENTTYGADCIDLRICEAVADVLFWSGTFFDSLRALSAGLTGLIPSDVQAQAVLGHADLVREIVGNPFRPSKLQPSTITADALRIATVAYDSHEFGCLPILSDALEEAGCTDTDLLAHLRSPGPHVRGCWALDHILGKS
jgi:hypothetical protein